MKLYYVSVCLTFVLCSQMSRNEPIPLEPSSSKVSICTTEECRRTAEMLRGSMIPWGNPCKDFYHFACGRFFNRDLPIQIARYAYDINEKILGYLNSDNNHNIQAITKIQYIFKLCIDEDAIEMFGDKVIYLQLNNAGLPSMPPFHPQTNIPNNFGRTLAKLHRKAGIPFLFSIDVNKDPEDFTKNRLFIQLDSFTVQYIESRILYYEINRRKRDKYFKKYMMGVVKYLYQIEEINLSDEILELVSGRVDEVVQFLLRADKVTQEYFYSPSNYEYITIQKLQEKTDKILFNTNIKFNWQEYLLQIFENILGNDVEDYFSSGEPLIVDKMKYLESIFEVISRINADVFRASIWWVTVNDMIDLAYKKLRKLYEKFEEKTFGFNMKREGTCFNFIKDRYSYALTHLLLQEVNLKNTIYEIGEMNENLKEIFMETIKNASWMDELTRKEARRKLYNMRTFISHDTWVANPQKIEKKYAGVTVEHSWYETRLKENVRRVEEKLKLLFVTNKKYKRQFPMNVLATNSAYNHLENIGDIPFGMLGQPYINNGLISMNYGGIGHVLGYLMTMLFDEAGRKIDSCGREKNWWERSTLQEFNNRANCFVDFYSKFTINGKELQMDGKRTLDSNISDNVAMKLVLSAYEKYEQNYGEGAKLIGFQNYSSEQLLTLAMANSMCMSFPQDDFYKKYEMENHSIPYQRVNGIFMNSQKMSIIWRCPEGSRMNPKNKCYMF